MTAARARCALLLLLSALLAPACGSRAPSAAERANTALLDRVPVYPGARVRKTTPGDAFSARDFTLPRNRVADVVINWTIARLQSGGWRVTGKSFDTIRAERRGSAVSVGVRGRTLEIVASAP